MGQFYFFRFSKERGTDGYFNHINYNSMLTIRYSILMGFEFIEDYAVDLHKKKKWPWATYRSKGFDDDY